MNIVPDPQLVVPRVEAAEALARRTGKQTADMYELLCAARQEQITARDSDPFGHGFVPRIWTIVWSLLDWPYWPKALEDEAIKFLGVDNLWEFMKRVREKLGFKHPVNMVWVSGANRSGKSEMTAFTVNAHMAGKPGSLIVPMSTTSDQSRSSELQSKLHKYIPLQLRGVGKSSEGYIAYKEKTGFSENSFIYPNRSQCTLRFYSQDASTAGEGWSADGIFPDETIPADWFERIGPRIAARSGYCILTNTPQSGYSDVVHRFMNGCVVARWSTGYMLPKDGGEPDVARAIGLSDAEYKELCDDNNARPQRASHIPESRPEDCWQWLKEEPSWKSMARHLNEAPSVQEGNRLFEAVPRVARCEDDDKAIVWFYGSDNPFGRPRNLLEMSSLQDRDWTRCRVYGVVAPSQRSVFVNFRRSIHVRRACEVPLTGSRYMVLDPAFTRNGFMLWALVTGKTMWIYREFPGQYSVPEKGVPGPWAKTSGRKGGANDGEKDEGATSFGWGYLRYKNIIARLEGWRCAGDKRVDEEWDDDAAVRSWRDSPFGEDTSEPIVRRIMDPRGGAAPTVKAEAATTPMIEYSNLGMRFEPAYSGSIVAGVDAIQNALDWGNGKEPTLYISEECSNLIWSMENWKFLDGEKGATKDPIDCLRYLFTSGCVDVGAFAGRSRSETNAPTRYQKSLQRYGRVRGRFR